MSRVLHVVFKTHLDLGFTGYAETVRRQYHAHFIPMALDTGEHFLRENFKRPAFIWTTGSWLIWDHLQTQSPDKVARLERGIANGIIRWHALPFTTHTELMSPALLSEALSISAELDQRFGITTRAAKMTDVPGHTLGLVPLLARAGVTFLHIGVNSASTPPDVPPLFRWRAPDGEEIIVAYHTTYGATLFPEGSDHGLAFAHTNDNVGPQNVGHVVDGMRHFSEASPGFEIRASTLDAFAETLEPIHATLPVVTDEIADTWIHGISSAPQRVSRFLAARRGFDGFAAAGALTPARRAFGRKLMEVPEHTWGVDIKTYLRDETAWDRPAFGTARETDRRFAITEGAWAEQDSIIDKALALLTSEDRACCIAQAPAMPPPIHVELVDDSIAYRLGDHALSFNAKTGALSRIETAEQVLIEAIDGSDGLFGFIYETYDAADYEAYRASYLTEFPRWAIEDNGKPGLENATTAASKRFATTRPVIGQTPSGALVVTDFLPDDASTLFGAPARVEVSYVLSGHDIVVTARLAAKPACRLPEAGFLSFSAAADPDSWRMQKLGQRISPLSVVSGGNRHLHAVDAVSGTSAQGVPFHLATLDAPLFSPGGQPFLPFVRTQPDMNRGGRFNLFNNKWGTNFSMWCEGDLSYRFVLHLGKD